MARAASELALVRAGKPAPAQNPEGRPRRCRGFFSAYRHIGRLVDVNELRGRIPWIRIAQHSGGHSFAVSRRVSPEFCQFPRPLRKEGAGNAGRPMRPIAACARDSGRAHTSFRSHRKSPGIPRAMVLRLISCSPRRPAFLPPSPAECFRQLDASVGASGPHDFAVRIMRPSSIAPSASTASRPAFVTMRNAPLCGTGRRGYRSDLPFGKPEYFCERGWTGKSLICPSG